ncbi:MAG TPA: beta-L-arabinofuranosidase domain-containing protein [Aggregatilineaceae bacterium]|nr:beta-L-arabinofuranosidase domain-containing protein [Aggregatilineaceae bacterium]
MPYPSAAVRAADCVLASFGPSKRFVHPTGPHNGMASSSILEPMIWLYFETGEERFLRWGKWLVDVDWEAPAGPHTLSILLDKGSVADVGGGKGIEMLTNFAGLLELYRVTADERYLTAVVNAWNDIVQHQLYITGTSSTGEVFSRNYLLRNDGVYRIGETCVSMGWMYLNLSLGRLTGDSGYFDMAEIVIYNHLLGA